MLGKEVDNDKVERAWNLGSLVIILSNLCRTALCLSTSVSSVIAKYKIVRKLTSLGFPSSFTGIRFVKLDPGLPGASTMREVSGSGRRGRFLGLPSQSEILHDTSLTGRSHGIVHGIEVLSVGGGELPIDIED